MRDYIEHLKAKPEAERRRVALAVSTGVALVVFFGWTVSLVSSGTLALDSANSEVVTPSAQQTNDGLAGAAAAFSSVFSGEGTLTAVEGDSSSTLDQQDTAEATVIPF